MRTIRGRDVLAIPRTSRRKKAFLFAGTAVLALLGTIYLVHGLMAVTAEDYEGGDLQWRWKEQVYVWHGINPYDISKLTRGLPLWPSEAARLRSVDRNDYVPIGASGYPPWAFFTGMAFVPAGDFTVTRYLFLTWSLAALCLTLAWVYLLSKRHGVAGAVFLTASVFAMAAIDSTLRLQQYGLLLNVLLVVLLLSEERKQALPAGLAFALALTKPSFTGLDAFLLLFRGRFVGLAVTAAYIVVASFVIGHMTRTNPLEMIHQMIAQSSDTARGGIGPLQVAIDHGAPYAATNMIFGLTGLGTSCALMYIYRSASPLTLLSIAAVIGRLATYHRQYDNVMLMFPLVALGLLMLERMNVRRTVGFLIFGTSLWAPLRYSDYSDLVQLVLALIWIGGLCEILAQSDRSERKRTLPAPTTVNIDPADR